MFVNGAIDEKTGIVTNVIDGDTFDLSNGDRIRPADINASEIYQEGGPEARDYLSSWIYGKTVYLDVDDKYIYDDYGNGDRFVCVVYVSYNSTHYLNINRLMVNAGHAEIKDYDNEFNPYSWSLFVLKPIIPTSTPTPTPSPTPTSTPEPTQTPSPTPVPTITPIPSYPTPTPTIDPEPFRFSSPNLIIAGTIGLLIAIGILAYYKKYRK
jgi:hypothetical protein